jgi:hypothetical protein
MEKEIWKDVLGYEGLYEVSNMGSVRSLDRITEGRNGKIYRKKGKILKLFLNGDGYRRVMLHKDFIQKTHTVHKLVAIAFLNHNPCGHKEVVNHKDFNRINNKVSNLEITSQRENTNKKHIKSSSKFVGVSFYKKSNLWISAIVKDGKRIYLGSFNSEKEASDFYENALLAIKNGKEINRKVRDKISSYKYVTFQKGVNKWRAGSNRGNMKYLGYFSTELEAKEAVDNYLKNKQNTTQCVV